MITALDHIVLITPDIEAGVRAYQTLLGVQPAWRTRGDGIATAMFTFANTSLELMAPDGESTGAQRVRAALEKDGEGLASLAVRVDDISRSHRRLDRVGLQPEAIADGRSTNVLDGARLSWQRTRRQRMRPTAFACSRCSFMASGRARKPQVSRRSRGSITS